MCSVELWLCGTTADHSHDEPSLSVCCVLCTGLGALRVTATPLRGPDQEVNLKKISDCGGRMT